MSDERIAGALPSAARWLALEPIVDAVLALPEERRAAYLAERCVADPELRADAERILAAAARLSDRDLDLEQPAYERFAALWDEQADEKRFHRAIAERFVVEAEAGRGGMAIVYRARDVRDGRVVALKVVRDMASSGGAVRFRREIALASRLTHPHILSPIDSGESAGRLWYTMPFMEGESLGARISRGPIERASSIEILLQIVSGLEHAHAHGIVHRDLKPDNVLLRDRRAVIADFGVAKAMIASAQRDGDPEQSTATGVTLGTPSHMAPEQAAGQKSIDYRADLYAFGIIAWQLFTGVLPFTGASRQALLTQQLTERPDVSTLRRHDVPARLESLIMQLLEKDVERRPASASDVRRTLETIASESSHTRSTNHLASWLRQLWGRR